jgi:ferredoxin
MAYKITDYCISCGACEGECQNQAITEGDKQIVIDPYICTECVGNAPSPKCAEVCPVDAPVPDPDHAENKEQLLQKWRKLHPGKVPV